MVQLLFAPMPAAMPHASVLMLGRAHQCPVLDQHVSSVSLRLALFRQACSRARRSVKQRCNTRIFWQRCPGVGSRAVASRRGS